MFITSKNCKHETDTVYNVKKKKTVSIKLIAFITLQKFLNIEIVKFVTSQKVYIYIKITYL